MDDLALAAITASILLLLICTAAAFRWTVYALSRLYRRGMWSAYASALVGVACYIGANLIEQSFVLFFRLADYGLLPRGWRDVGYYSPSLVAGRKLLMVWGALLIAHTMLCLVRGEPGRAYTLFSRSFVVTMAGFTLLTGLLYVALTVRAAL